MLSALTSWEIASLIFKLLWYIGVIAAVGGTFSVWFLEDASRRGLQQAVLYGLVGALIGFHAVILYFLVQVGAINDSGLAGMLDWTIISFYLGLGVGETSLLRMAVFLLLVLGQIGTLSYLGRLARPPGQDFFRFYYRLNAAALLLLLLSFQATGHVATLSLPVRTALFLHVLCVSLWLGSLWPLLTATKQLEPAALQLLMQRFSSRASVMVGVLLVAALLMVTRLLTTPAELINTPYGLSLLLKITLVCTMLSLAALNRWFLVPMLDKPDGVLHLRRSIRLEMATGLVVLILTSVLSTVVGPMSHS